MNEIDDQGSVVPNIVLWEINYKLYTEIIETCKELQKTMLWLSVPLKFKNIMHLQHILNWNQNICAWQNYWTATWEAVSVSSVQSVVGSLQDLGLTPSLKYKAISNASKTLFLSKNSFQTPLTMQ